MNLTAKCPPWPRLIVALLLTLTLGLSTTPSIGVQAQTPGTVRDGVRLADLAGGMGGLPDTGLFGASVAVIGDLDRDGVADLAAGAPGTDVGGTDRGAVYILFMEAGGTVRSYRRIAHRSGGLGDLVNGDRFGSAVAGVGDLDRDGIPDLAVGAPGDDLAGHNQGALHVLLLDADGSVRGGYRTVNPESGVGDAFGTSLAALGDLDRDGIPDLAAGAPGDDTGGPDRGAAYILFLNANGSTRSSHRLAHRAGGLGDLANGDQFGHSLVTIGDLDRDGVADLAVGAWGDDTGGFNRGAVHVLFLRPGGSVRSQTRIAHQTGGLGSLNDGDQFGSAVAGPGDLNRDGIPDLAVGASADDTGGSARGAIYVLSMQADGTVREGWKIADRTAGLGALHDGDAFGFAAAAADVDGDGMPDLAVGAPGDDGGGMERGAVYVLLLYPQGVATDGGASAEITIAHQSGGMGSLIDRDTFGWSAVSLGDLDRDGVPDLAVGAPGDDTGGTDRGAVYVLFMNASGTVRAWVRIAHRSGGLGGLADYDMFGRALAVVGDLDRDGLPELVVGAPGDDTGDTMRGAVYVLFLTTGGTVRHQVKIADNSIGLGPLNNGDQFGSAAAGVGDLDRDGIPDLAVGAPGDDTGGSGRGAVHLLFLSASGGVREQSVIAHGSAGMGDLADGAEFGSAVAGIGDLNRDGVPDLAVGAPGDGTVGPGRGAVYLLFMGGDGSAGSYTVLSDGLGPLNDYDRFGYAAAGIGDLDHDGIPDLAVGAPGDDTGGISRGAVHVLLLDRQGGVDHQAILAHQSGGMGSLADGDQFGCAVAGIGDVNRDGMLDMAAGAPLTDSGGEDRGALYVLLMRQVGDSLTLSKSVTPERDVPYHGEITYTLTLRNIDPVPDPKVTLLDALPAQADFVRWTVRPPGAAVTDDQVTWNGALGGGETVTVQFVARHNGDFEETVRNTAVYTGSVSEGSADAAFTVAANQPPTAHAGADRAVPLGVQVTLDGTGSRDPEEQPLTYDWTQTGGPAVVLDSPAAARPSFVAPMARAMLTFTLSVADAAGLESLAPDTVAIQVSDEPLPYLALSKTVTPALEVPYHGEVTYTLALGNDGTAHESGAALGDPLPAEVAFERWIDQPPGAAFVAGAVMWDGALDAGQVVTLSFVARHNGSLGETVRNTAFYTGSNIVDSVEAWFTVALNQAPTADAGFDQTVLAASRVTLDGTGSHDPEGGALTYGWTQTAGPPVALDDPSAARAAFTAPYVPALVAFSLVVTDSAGLSSPVSDTVLITVSERLLADVFVPLILVQASPPAGPVQPPPTGAAPDLVIDSLIATGNYVRLVVRNQGDAPVAEDFWVDVYVDPDMPPERVNQTWPLLGSQGLVWGVLARDRPLAPGAVLVLEVNGTYYDAARSSVSWPLAASAPIYAQVDSADVGTTYGAVYERHEIDGGPYNNIAFTLAGGAGGDAAGPTPPATIPFQLGTRDLPPRP